MRQEVIDLMGETSAQDTFTNFWGRRVLLSATNPYKTELLQGKDKVFEVLYYYTDVKRADGAITDDELTPLVFDDGKLLGWCQSFLNENILKYENRVR